MTSQVFAGRPVIRVNRNGRQVACVSGQVVVKLKGFSRKHPEALLEFLPANSSVEGPTDELGTTIVNLPASSDVLEVARHLEDQDSVEYAEPNYIDAGS